MKKCSIAVLCVLCSLVGMCQDIIVLQSGEEIAAKVIKVGSEEVEYRKWSNQDGPIYSLTPGEIFMIKYQNGEKDVFTHTNASVQANEAAMPVNMLLTDNDCLYRKGNTYIFKGMEMRGADYEQFLYNNCNPAFAQYMSGKNLSRVGWGLLGAGCALEIAYIVMVYMEAVRAAYYSTFTMPTYALVTGVVGEALEIACIPTLIVAYTRMHRSADIYNMQCASRPQAYIGVGASRNGGWGLSFNF